MPEAAPFYAFLALLAAIVLWRAIRRARNIQRVFGPQGLADYRLLKQAGGRAAGLKALGVTEEELDYIAKHGTFPPGTEHAYERRAEPARTKDVESFGPPPTPEKNSLIEEALRTFHEGRPATSQRQPVFVVPEGCDFKSIRDDIALAFHSEIEDAKSRGKRLSFKTEFVQGWDEFWKNPCREVATRWIESSPDYIKFFEGFFVPRDYWMKKARIEMAESFVGAGLIEDPEKKSDAE